MPTIECPQCATELEIDRDEAGGRIRCPECDHLFTARSSERKSSRRTPRDEDEPSERLPKRPKKNGFAIASMCCGIVAVVAALAAIAMSIFGVACMAMCCCPLPYVASYGGIGLSSVLGVLGLVLGVLGMKLQAGKGMAWTGIATSGVAILIALVLVILNLVGAIAINAMPPPTVPSVPNVNDQPPVPSTKLRPVPITRPGKRP